ncbi:MAG: enoyl-CoA hydratase [Rhizobiales bacterium]|nr:enoyl-CoA hydratase [Hyphomicrobiales bacterium]MBI3674464.1 enoyl-CoA hydratase [Hyphomicrobiales bacterium]
MSELVIAARQAGVLRLTLNDSVTRNSLSEAMMAALHASLDAAATDASARVVVIAATGPAFCSGHNLKEITAHRADLDHGAACFERLFNACSALMLTIVNHPKPVIAEVQGLASAAGCQLVASCDLAVAADTASFCTPGVNIGLFCSTPMVALSRTVAPKHAMEMLLTGTTIPAAEARRIGLINRVVSPNSLSETVDELAQKIAGKSQTTLRLGKAAFYRQLDLPLAEAYAMTARVMTENLLKHDAEEGIAAFIDKRAPSWSDE